jgi:hypothetical protein
LVKDMETRQAGREPVVAERKADTDLPKDQRSGTAGKRRLALAFAVAGISDVLAFVLTLAPPVQWGIDIVTALLLFLLLGRKWAILPGLIAEAIPGLYIFPFWLLVVGSIAIWGSVRRPSGTEAPPRADGSPRSEA